ncbi:MAG: xylose isomerase, partial [Gemmatimonadaceae bacterium]
EVAHERMAGLDFSHGVAQALDAGKLFHIDLNDQKPGRFDQDLRFGSDDPKGAFFLVKLLEEAAWTGMRHFDSHAYRTEDEDGVWAFAAGSMRSYLIFKEKVQRFEADVEIQQLVNELASRGDGEETGERGVPAAAEGAAGLRFDAGQARALRERTFDLPSLRRAGFGYERLDQLTMELLLGVR